VIKGNLKKGIIVADGSRYNQKGQLVKSLPFFYPLFSTFYKNCCFAIGLFYPEKKISKVIMLYQWLILGWLFGKKDPIKAMEEKHAQLLAEARDIQRSGNLRLYADKIAEAEKLEAEIAKAKEAAEKG